MSLRIYGNRLLKTLPGQDTRPTLARVRTALFNIWQGELEGCRWLDLCSGSGAMGAEALCRGAASVVGIEQSARACAIIAQNWRQVANADQPFQVMRGTVEQRLPRLKGQQFDRIYFDPPYVSGLYEPVLEAIARYDLLADRGELATEHDPDRPLPDQILTLQRCRQKIYGNTALSFYCHAPTPSPGTAVEAELVIQPHSQEIVAENTATENTATEKSLLHTGCKRGGIEQQGWEERKPV